MPVSDICMVTTDRDVPALTGSVITSSHSGVCWIADVYNLKARILIRDICIITTDRYVSCGAGSVAAACIYRAGWIAYVYNLKARIIPDL